MKMFSRSALLAAVLLLGAGALMPMAQAQVPSLPPGPYNVPSNGPVIGSPSAVNVINNVGAGTGTYTSNLINNVAYAGAWCTFNQASHTGTPSSTIEIDAYDSASSSFQKFVQTAAITADGTPTSVMVYPGITLTTTPTGMVIEALKLPRYFQVKEVVGGSNTSTITGTVGCDLLR